MSDFVTRLVERQAGTAAVVQPRTPSMFAPPMSRSGRADVSMIDPLAPIEQARQTPADSLRSRDDGNQAPTHSDQSEAQRPSPRSRSASRAAEELHRAVAAPAPVVRKASVIVTESAHPMPAASSVDSLATPEQKLREQSGVNRQHIEDPADPPASHSPAGMAPLPLVKSRPDTGPSAAAAPPSLASGMNLGRRTEPNQAAATEPPVEVTIGRIEVTAVTAASDQKRKPGARRPAMSLEEYLARRQGGRP